MRLIPLLILAALAASCGSRTPEAQEPTTPAAPSAAGSGAGAPAPAPPTPAAPAAAAATPKRNPEHHFEDAAKIPDAALAGYHVRMTVAVDNVEVGTLVFGFWPEKAPKAVRNFLRYCDEGFYDGLLFHRVLRDFMIQGGSSTNDGGGEGPNGKLPAEFSLDPRWNHRYGVLSMARGGEDPDSASSQFFLCCDDSVNTAGLNGKYSSFGQMVEGVMALEALASVPVRPNPRGEPSFPLKKGKIVTAVVVASAAPAPSEIIARPIFEAPPLKIAVQHILISFAGTGTKATRSKAEAELLAADVYARAKQGEDFVTLLKENSDDGFNPADPNPSIYKMHADDYILPGAFAAYQKLQARWYEALKSKEADYRAGKITARAFLAEIDRLERAELMKELGSYVTPPAGSRPRSGLVPAFGDVGWALKVGEIGLAPYDPRTSEFGWHIIRRTE